MSLYARGLGQELTSFIDEAISEGLDDKQALGLLKVIRDVTKYLRIFDDELVKRISAGKSQGELVEDRATIRYGSKKTEWDRAGARHAILALERDVACSDRLNTAVDPETGEVVPTWVQCLAVVDRYWLQGPKGDRVDPLVTPIKAAGLDPNEFRATSGRTVIVELL